MVKYPKKFCYYCNHIIDYRCQRWVQCGSCETVCHAECINFECDEKIPKMTLRKGGNRSLKIANKKEVLLNTTKYTCNVCCLKEAPFSAIITNSKGAIKNKFSTVKHKESRSIADCIEPAFLNSLFYSTENRDDEIDSRHNHDEGFRPIPDKYFDSSHIELSDYNINLHKQKEIKESNTFSSLGINMRSLANTKNFAKLQVFIASLCFQPTVIAINETYLKDDEDGPHCNLENYTFKSNCRKSCKGGGVGLYIHDSLQYKIREDLKIMDEKVFESFFIETLNLKNNLIFGTVYRSPKQESETVLCFMNHLKECLNAIDKSNKPCFIQGDFNFNLIDTDDTNVSDFKENMFDNSFYSLINKPTRITDRSATCIDHIWSNVFDENILSGIITEMIADHMATFQSCNICFNKINGGKNKKNHEKRKINFNKLENDLEVLNVDRILNCPDVDIAYGQLQSCIDDAIERSTHIQRKKSRESNKWFDHELFKLRSKRQMLYHKKIKDNTTRNKLVYDEIKKTYEKLIIQKKKKILSNFNKEVQWGYEEDLGYY